MTAEECVAFLEALRAKNIRVKANGWVEASCLLARWTHKDHIDRSPSFGLSIVPGGRSHFMCFACRQGSAEELLSSLEMYTYSSKDYDFARCHQILSEEQVVMPLPEYGEFAKPDVVEPWPQYWLDSFQKAEWVDSAMTYLISRGVSMTTIKEFDLRFDPKRQMIVSPYRDVFGRLVGARGRSIEDSVSKFKHYDYSWQGKNNARLCWFHEPVLNMAGPVVVTEGQFDCMRAVQAFPKTVANLTAKPMLEKMKKLGDCGLVVQIPDRDEAGQQSIQVYARLCHQLGLQHRAIWLDEGVKDPAQCSVEYLKDKILQSIAAT